MDFAIEDYVRVYTRDTTTWLLLGWEGQCTLLQLLRRVDHAGRLAINDMDPVSGVALMTSGPVDFVAKGVASLFARGVLVRCPGYLLLPRFVEAQAVIKARRPVSEEVRIQVLDEHGMVCWLCLKDIAERRDLHLDHVVPRSLGGSDEVENLRPAHSKCNIRRGNRDPEKFRQLLAAESMHSAEAR